MNKARKSVRQRLLEAIKKNGGFRRRRNGFFMSMLSWPDIFIRIDYSREAVRSHAIRIGTMRLEEDATVAWDDDEEYENAVVRKLFLRDTASPSVLKRHGLVDDPLNQPMANRNDRPTHACFDVKLDGMGHDIQLEKFEWCDLTDCEIVGFILGSLERDGYVQVSSELREDGFYDYDVFSNESARRLLAMIEEWDQCFTPQRASEAVMDNLAHEYAKRCAEWHTENDERQAWAERDVVTV